MCHLSPLQADYYLPKSLSVTLSPSLARGDIGADAEDGYIAFNLVSQPSETATSFAASWLVVMDLAGGLRTVAALEDAGDVQRAGGLKPWDDDNILFAAGNNSAFRGSAFKMDWRTGAYAKMSSVHIDIHDVQRSHAVAYSHSYDDAFWASDTCCFYMPVQWGVEAATCADVTDPPGRVYSGQPVKRCAISPLSRPRCPTLTTRRRTRAPTARCSAATSRRTRARAATTTTTTTRTAT